MSAAEIALALGDARREGPSWRCRCPLHGGRSLVLRDGYAERLLVKCWGGCITAEVLAELRRLGLMGHRAREYRAPVAVTRRDDAARTAGALSIWREARPIQRTIVETYLRSRGIALRVWPPTLRFHPRCLHPSGARLPAMVALVEHWERGPVAIHRTYLSRDGCSQASIPKPKAMFGPVGGGAVRLGIPRAGAWLAVAEGIETVLAVVAACEMPGWAALSEGGIRALVLPPEATHVLICADHDQSGVGQRAASDAGQRWLTEGRRVRIAMPPDPATDMADVLSPEPSIETMQRLHVG
jgi:putative DNA primase/helicase